MLSNTGNSYELPSPICIAPDAAEINARLINVRSRMATHGLDFYLVTDPDNVFYLTNFANFVHERPFLLIVPMDGPLHFIVPKLEVPHVTDRSIGDLDLITYLEYPAPPGQRWSDQLAHLLAKGKRVGIESCCALKVYNEVPVATVQVDIIDDVRMVKSPYEIGRLVYAASLMTEGHSTLLSLAKPGVKSVQINSEVSKQLMMRMLKDNPHANLLASKFVGIVQPPHLSHDPHNFTDTFMACSEGGPHVTIVSGRANGYGAELERTFFIGSVPDTARRPFDVMLKAREKTFELLKPGASMSEIDEVVTDVFIKMGYEDNILHRTGHGFGVTNHEAPFLARGYDRIVEAGMVFSVEPGIYLSGIGGFRYSDTVLVTESGNVCLTRAPDTLEALTIDG
jgi:Xaa-Pro dipeptidase